MSVISEITTLLDTGDGQAGIGITLKSSRFQDSPWLDEAGVKRNAILPSVSVIVLKSNGPTKNEPERWNPTGVTCCKGTNV